ncbi:MAG: zinc ribbon domain-containing protein [Acidobacteria bacterium]|nr:MAG: zinc ribbon domain-containing protein [Acidobacteriota bacterium]REK01611.1 MAG: zinc ribbon domain-containing protein [Acidobacteriota bacterium]REK14567.1 MAG: zinc ribbon domain-containing protein [Acidobacteriota bacterium]REK45282.1 MAG: zinc ribbon domain-containing protein [Acidobacteriota bacterium]
MIECGNCGQENPDSALFCRRCGMSFRDVHSRQRQRSDFEKSPPRPYSWSTGEFQGERRGARDTEQIEYGQPIDDPFRTSELPARHGDWNMRPVYRCPHCGTTALPIVTKRVSSAGWAVFTLLLIFTLFLFWIGLLMQEEVRVCSVCKGRID